MSSDRIFKMSRISAKIAGRMVRKYQDRTDGVMISRFRHHDCIYFSVNVGFKNRHFSDVTMQCDLNDRGVHSAISREMKDQTLNFVERTKNLGNYSAMVFTGVGFGGGLAQLFAHHARKVRPDLDIYSIDFAAPRIGCREFYEQARKNGIHMIHHDWKEQYPPRIIGFSSSRHKRVWDGKAFAPMGELILGPRTFPHHLITQHLAYFRHFERLVSHMGRNKKCHAARTLPDEG